MTKTYHIIYRTICLITNRYYYGMHSTDNVDDGYLGSGKFLANSIKKHGVDNHVCEHLEFLENREKLREREREIVNDDLLKDSLCMNLKKGGDGGGGLWNEEHAQKFHAAGGKKVLQILNQRHVEKLKTDAAYKEKYRKTLSVAQTGSKNGFFGKQHTPEYKKAVGLKNSIHQSGEGNSMHNKCWITNEIESKTMKKGESLPDGWRFGRKMAR